MGKLISAIETSSDADDRYLVPGLSRGLRALQAFTPDRPRLTLAQIAARLGITRSAAYRLVYTLDRLGFLVHEPMTRSYLLGPAVLRLGYGYVASRDLTQAALPALEALRDRTGWSAHLGVLEGREVLYLARVATRRALASVVQVGSRLPAHATTMGRVLLAALDDDTLRTLYAGQKLAAYSNRTVRTLAGLLRQARTDGAAAFVTHIAEYEPGVASVAAPVSDVSGTVVAAINISSPAMLTSEAEMRGPLRHAVQATAAAISASLGHIPSGHAALDHTASRQAPG